MFDDFFEKIFKFFALELSRESFTAQLSKVQPFCNKIVCVQHHSIPSIHGQSSLKHTAINKKQTLPTSLHSFCSLLWI